MENTVRTRIAPSPTGYPHIGTIYQALFNYAFAKKYSGKFIVRIEDTDRSRFVEGAEEVIFSSLDWFGLTEDESPRKSGDVGPYRQSERLGLYHTYVQELIAGGKAYFSYFKRDEAGKKKDYTQKSDLSVTEGDVIPEGKEPSSIKEMIEMSDWVVKMKVPKDTTIKVHDEIRGDIEFDSGQVTEQVLLKSDGFPTYHLAVVVDDHLMKISHIVRAEEWISSLPKHKLLYEYFGWEMPPIYHTATLRNPDKSKLSKRHGHTNVTWFRENGYLPEAILNYLALLGWSHPQEKEIFSLDEFISLFDLKDVKPVAPIFDLVKLNWMNQQYIQKMDDEDLVKRLNGFYPYLSDNTDLLKKLLPLLKTRMETLKDFEVLAGHFFADSTSPSIHLNDAVVVSEKIPGTVVEATRDKLNNIADSDWNKDTVFAALREVMSDQKVRMPIFYSLFTGRDKGLPLPESLEILGKEKTLQRIS